MVRCLRRLGRQPALPPCGALRGRPLGELRLEPVVVGIQGRRALSLLHPPLRRQRRERVGARRSRARRRRQRQGRVPRTGTARGCAAAGDAVPDASHPPRAGRSEEHTSELQSLMRISYAVFCLKKKKNTIASTLISIKTNITNTTQ